jgi:ubiquinone biosynthesis O-methyltransferase
MLGPRRFIISGCLRRFLSTNVIVEPANVIVAPANVIVEPAHVARTSVDPAEIGRFTNMANEWLDENGPMKILHAFNRVRIPWIVDELKRHRTVAVDDREPLKGLRMLDVGSGCGILTFPLARLGAQIDGLEPSLECVHAADTVKDQLLPEKCSQRIKFLPATVEEHCVNHREEYDAVVVSEVIEHVADVPLFIQSCHEMAKPGAPIFFSTINRTVLSQIVAIQLAEGLGFVPKGTHEWNKFVTPDELTGLLCDHRFQVAYTRGLFYDPLLNEWDWFISNLVNYALLARKI